MIKKGIVYSSTGSHYRVESGGKFYYCSIKGKFRIKGIKSTNPIAVGDRVVFTIESEKAEKTGVITEIEVRQNYIVRKSVNLSKQIHIIAANIDQVFLMITLKTPPTYPAFIDRFLVSTEAFDVNKEDRATLARYDTSQFISDSKYTDKKNGQSGRHWYQTNARTLGRLLLLARRLCQAGAGFVTVTTQFVWDMHADGNNLGVGRGMEAVGNPYDHAVSAFIEDCEARGLSNDIMLVSTGEMGRTPRINKNGGRDHWGRIAPLMIYGGGVTHGQVIGQSSKDGGEPITSPWKNENLVATILHNLFDIGELRLESGLPVDLLRFATTGTPISGLTS